MSTIFVVIAVLFGALLVGTLVERIFRFPNGTAHGGSIGLALCYVFFGIGHFVLTEPMAEMLPAFIPARHAIVYVTGAFEFLIAVGLAVPEFRRVSGLVSLGVLVLFFPVNVYSSIAGVGLGDNQYGVSYLWFRTPLQIVLIFWSYWFAVRWARNPKP